eukprot:4015283-Prymnesium_polylepis.1
MAEAGPVRVALMADALKVKVWGMRVALMAEAETVMEVPMAGGYGMVVALTAEVAEVVVVL